MERSSPILHAVTVAQTAEVNEYTRIVRLDFDAIAKGANFLPGQWLNLHLKNSGLSCRCSIISAPSAALAAEDITLGSKPHIEVIIQNAPTPLIQSSQAGIFLPVGTQLNISFGGSFVWPPNSVGTASITRVVFLAGGVVHSYLSYHTCLRQIQHQKRSTFCMPPVSKGTTISHMFLDLSSY
ncbi:unnamed protein product [Periconia digitata]|uniref:Uncharacterized protein n=1 Tax=Periconia digitata TaxID=1303443 RepID=A0A9W4U234_9PLEO|nr:unnamed protein product [Periconia digitata]